MKNLWRTFLLAVKSYGRRKFPLPALTAIRVLYIENITSFHRKIKKSRMESISAPQVGDMISFSETRPNKLSTCRCYLIIFDNNMRFFLALNPAKIVIFAGKPL